MSLLNRHQIFIDNQCYASLKGSRGGFGESIRKRKVFSEALAIAFPTAILQIDYPAVHIASLTNLLVGCLVLVTGLTLKATGQFLEFILLIKIDVNTMKYVLE